MAAGEEEEDPEALAEAGASVGGVVGLAVPEVGEAAGLDRLDHFGHS